MRTRKLRNVEAPPPVFFYKPSGVPMKDLAQVQISVEEYEAIRLAQYEAMKHHEACELMGVSRSTFTRLLEAANKKVADAFVNGKAIAFSGGRYHLANELYWCTSCTEHWRADPAGSARGCPSCGSMDVEAASGRLEQESGGTKAEDAVPGRRGGGRRGRGPGPGSRGQRRKSQKSGQGHRRRSQQ